MRRWVKNWDESACDSSKHLVATKTIIVDGSAQADRARHQLDTLLQIVPKFVSSDSNNDSAKSFT